MLINDSQPYRLIMNQKKQIVITGTGRTGTTFLVELLTHLGLDTGFETEDINHFKSDLSNAGLEYRIGSENCPYIAKDPWFCDYAEEVIQRKDIILEHVYIPVRDLNSAAESRRYVTKKGYSELSYIEKFKHLFNPKDFPGGLWHTKSTGNGKQEEVLLNQLYKVIYQLSGGSTDVTLMQYPKITRDPKYLYKKLESILKDIQFDMFQATFHEVVQPDIVHKFHKDD